MAGKGSVEYRGGTSWRLVASCGLGTNGKQVKKTKTVQAKDEDDARKQLEKFLNEVDGGIDISSGKLSFERFVKERWLPKYAEKELADKTVYEYKKYLEKRIYPAMGHLKMNKIRPSHIIDFIDMMSEEGMRQDDNKEKKTLSSNSILHYFRLISSVLSTAVQWQVIHENPAKRVKPPKIQKQKAPAYDEVQTANLLKALENVDFQYKVIVILGLALGVRRGELMGIEWKHLDLIKGTVIIEQSSQYLPGAGIFHKDPKNQSSDRLIALPKSVILMLKQYKAYQSTIKMELGNKWVKSDRLFTQWNGAPMHPDTISKWFPKFLEANGLPRIPFKNLRHTSATLLIGSNAPLKNVSTRLGHTNINTTANVYADSLKSVDKELAATMDKILVGEKPKKKVTFKRVEKRLLNVVKNI